MKNQFDYLNCQSDKDLQSTLEQGEYVIMSCEIDKFNHVAKQQIRIFIITNRHIINMKKPSILTNTMSFFSLGFKIKRKIPINKISHIISSKSSFEFILCVPSEYDYRFSSGKRIEILQQILQAHQKISMERLEMFFTDDYSLVMYHSSKSDKKSNIMRKPPGEPMYCSAENIEKQFKSLTKKYDDVYRDFSSKNIKIEDFKIIKVLGRGGFGKVMLVEKKDNGELIALKSIRKELVIEQDMVEHLRAEREILQKMNHPFLVNLKYAFQSNEKIFLGMEFVRGGELFSLLASRNKFPESMAQFYAAELILAFEYIHKQDIVYRDLKPENILLDEEGHLKLTDFGLAKILNGKQTTQTFVGTLEFLCKNLKIIF